VATEEMARSERRTGVDGVTILAAFSENLVMLERFVVEIWSGETVRKVNGTRRLSSKYL
jgi:hypothetical protein